MASRSASSSCSLSLSLSVCLYLCERRRREWLQQATSFPSSPSCTLLCCLVLVMRLTETERMFLASQYTCVRMVIYELHIEGEQFGAKARLLRGTHISFTQHTQQHAWFARGTDYHTRARTCSDIAYRYLRSASAGRVSASTRCFRTEVCVCWCLTPSSCNWRPSDPMTLGLCSR